MQHLPAQQTVAFTATLTQIAADPVLFHFTLAPIEQARDRYRQRRRRRRRASLEGHTDPKEDALAAPAPSKCKTLGRDRRMFGIFSLCVGAGVAECLLYSRIGLRGAMAISAAFKILQVVSI